MIMNMDYKTGFEKFMDRWRNMIEVSERTLVDNIAATVPWFAPSAPAYMIWHNIVAVLRWPEPIAWLVALAVEGLGLAVVSTAFRLWRAGASSFKVAVATVIFYLTVVIVVNVGFDLGWPHWIAKGLLSLLSIPGAVTLALRSQFRQDDARQMALSARQEQAQVQAEEKQKQEALAAEEREHRRKLEAEEREYQRRVDEQERERRHELKKLAKQVSGKLPESFRAVSGDFPESSTGFRQAPESLRAVSGAFPEMYTDIRQVPESEYAYIREHSPAEIAEKYHLGGKDPERKARNWKSYLKQEEP